MPRGWVLGLAVASLLIVLVAGSAAEPGSDGATGVNWGMAAIGALFVGMAARLWKKRPKAGETAEMPGWMATINSLSLLKMALLGAALAAANPKNLALTLAASASIAQAELDRADTAVAIAVFVAIGSVTVLGAVLFFVATPTRAARPLAAMKQFMATNNATIMMVVLLLLGAKFLGDAIAGVWS